MNGIPLSRKIEQEIAEVLGGCEAEGHPLDNFIRLGARYMLQVACQNITKSGCRSSISGGMNNICHKPS